MRADAVDVVISHTRIGPAFLVNIAKNGRPFSDCRAKKINFIHIMSKIMAILMNTAKKGRPFTGCWPKK